MKNSIKLNKNRQSKEENAAESSNLEYCWALPEKKGWNRDIPVIQEEIYGIPSIKNMNIDEYIPVEEETKEKIEKEPNERIIEKYSKDFAYKHFEKKKKGKNSKEI